METKFSEASLVELDIPPDEAGASRKSEPLFVDRAPFKFSV